MLAGTVSDGGVVSSTVTVNDPLSPRGGVPESVTVQLTVVVPSGKVCGDGGLQLGVGSGSSSASVAVAE